MEYNTDYLQKAETMGALVTSDFENHAVGYGAWGSLLLQQAYPFYEIVIVGENAEQLLSQMSKTYIANTILVGSKVESEISLFKDRYIDEYTFIYVCQNNTCKLPVKTIDEGFQQMVSFGYKGFKGSH